MRGTSGGGDDYSKTTIRRTTSEIGQQIWRAMGRDNPVSHGTPNIFSMSTACRIVSQSEELPMMTATNGAGFLRAITTRMLRFFPSSDGKAVFG